MRVLMTCRPLAPPGGVFWVVSRLCGKDDVIGRFINASVSVVMVYKDSGRKTISAKHEEQFDRTH